MSDIEWREVLNLDDTQLSDLRNIAYAYLKQGHYDTALKIFKALVILTKDNAYDFQTLGALYLQVGDHLTALDYLEKALRLDPDHSPTKLNRVKALLSLGYMKQGLMQAQILSNDADLSIANAASALIMAYS